MGKFDPSKTERRAKEMQKEKEARDEKRKKTFVRKLPVVTGKNIFRLKETETDSPYAWEEMGIHFQCGPSGKEQFRCLRDIISEEKKGYQPPSVCPQCSENADSFGSGNKKRIMLAKKRGRSERILLEGLCLTPLAKFLEGDREKMPKPKECFGNFAWQQDSPNFEKCESCSSKTAWGKVCRMGLGYLNLGPTIAGTLLTQAPRIAKKFSHNPFSLKEGHNFEFIKAGEGLDTVYSDVNFDLDSFELPKVVVKFVKENPLDWGSIYPKFSKEEMEAKMKGVEFFEDEELEEKDLEEEDLEEESEEVEEETKKVYVSSSEEEEEEEEEEDSDEEEDEDEEDSDEEEDEDEEEGEEEEEDEEEDEEEEEDDEESFMKAIDEEIEKDKVTEEKGKKLGDKIKKQVSEKKKKVKK